MNYCTFITQEIKRKIILKSKDFLNSFKRYEEQFKRSHAHFFIIETSNMSYASLIYK